MCTNSRKLLLAATAGLLTYLAWPRYGAAQTEPRPPLDDFTGTYRYHGGTTLALVAGDSALFAVIDEAKYPLRSVGGDRFVNGPGDTIPFRRDGAGSVAGFSERGTYFDRLTAEADPSAAQLVRARPRNGVYAYQPPPDLVAVFTGGACNAESSPPNAVMRNVLLPALLAERT